MSTSRKEELSILLETQKQLRDMADKPKDALLWLLGAYVLYEWMSSPLASLDGDLIMKGNFDIEKFAIKDEKLSTYAYMIYKKIPGVTFSSSLINKANIFDSRTWNWISKITPEARMMFYEEVKYLFISQLYTKLLVLPIYTLPFAFISPVVRFKNYFFKNKSGLSQKQLNRLTPMEEVAQLKRVKESNQVFRSTLKRNKLIANLMSCLVIPFTLYTLYNSLFDAYENERYIYNDRHIYNLPELFFLLYFSNFLLEIARQIIPEDAVFKHDTIVEKETKSEAQAQEKIKRPSPKRERNYQIVYEESAEENELNNANNQSINKAKAPIPLRKGKGTYDSIDEKYTPNLSEMGMFGNPTVEFKSQQYLLGKEIAQVRGNVEKAKFFIKSNLREDDFTLEERSYGVDTKFKNQLDFPKKVNQEGEQGIVFHNNKPFKVKILGSGDKGGDIRVGLRLVATNKQGQMLFETTEVERDHHKKLHRAHSK